MSNRATITLIVADVFTHVPTIDIRGSWTSGQSSSNANTNRIDFSAYTPSQHSGNLQIQFASNSNGTGSVTGYSVDIDSQNKVTFFTPDISNDRIIYGRYGDGTDWSNWFQIRVKHIVVITTVEITYGLTDRAGNPSGTAQTLNVSASRTILSANFMTPHTTSSSPYWYFDVPSGYALNAIKNIGFAMPVDDSANWVRVGATNRYINRTPIEGFTGNYMIEIRRI